MTATFLDYCPKCDKTTPHKNVRFVGGYNEVCQRCQGVTDIDLDDEFSEWPPETEDPQTQRSIT